MFWLVEPALNENEKLKCYELINIIHLLNRKKKTPSEVIKRKEMLGLVESEDT